MTLKEFFRKARKARVWGEVKRSHPMAEGTAVRCAEGFCPLGAVVTQKLRLMYRLPSPTNAAEALGLAPRFARRIANAADYDGSPDRKWLLKNLGVSGRGTRGEP